MSEEVAENTVGSSEEMDRQESAATEDQTKEICGL